MIEKSAETIRDAAERMWPGVTYDYAIPQDWSNTVRANGFEPRGQFVWGYPESSVWGVPLPLTIEAHVYLLKNTGSV